MEKTIQIPEWKFNRIYDALRLTNNIHKTYTKETCYDRVVDKAWRFAQEIDQSRELTTHEKITYLLELSDEFIFPAYYSHTDTVMWKISNPYTDNPETLVLCTIDEGIDTALDLAIEHILKRKEKFYGTKENNEQEG